MKESGVMVSYISRIVENNNIALSSCATGTILVISNYGTGTRVLIHLFVSLIISFLHVIPAFFAKDDLSRFVIFCILNKVDFVYAVF